MELLNEYAFFPKIKSSNPEQRSVKEVAQVVVSLHLAIEKATKFGLSKIDPALVVKSLSGDALQRLHRDRVQQKVPTILAVAGKDETHHLMGLLHIGKAFFVPPLDEERFDEFLGHVQDLVDIRNQIVHKEFSGEFDHVATVIVQVLSRFRPIMDVVAPGFLALVQAQDDQFKSRLNALEREVDGAWQVLIDYLEEGKRLEIPVDLLITLAPGSDLADISLYTRTLLANGITATNQILRRSGNGFLMREIPLPPPRPLSPFLLGLPSFAPSSSTGSPFFMLGSTSLQLPETQRPEDRVIEPSEVSSLTARNIPARLSLSLTGRKRSFLGLNVIVDIMELTFKAGTREGVFNATIRSTSNGGKAAQLTKIEVRGQAFLESEFATSGTEHFVAGTTLRKIRITATLEVVKAH